MTLISPSAAEDLAEVESLAHSWTANAKRIAVLLEELKSLFKNYMRTADKPAKPLLLQRLNIFAHHCQFHESAESVIHYIKDLTIFSGM